MNEFSRTIKEQENRISPSLVLSFKASVSLIEQPDGSVNLRLPFRDIPLTQASAGMLAALQHLSTQGATEAQLEGIVKEFDGNWGLSTLYYYLARFNQLGLLCHTLVWKGNKLATITPLSSAYQFFPVKTKADEAYILSRFAWLRRENQHFILESPLGYARVILHHRLAISILHALAEPCTLEILQGEFPDISAEDMALYLNLLICCKAISLYGQEVDSQAEKDALPQWDFHDLLFHTRSRLGRHTNLYGQDLHFLDKIAPPPAIKPPMSNKVIRLARPNIRTLQDDDLTLTHVLETRKSIRRHGDIPLTLEQLGEFLYRAARVRQMIRTDESPYEHSSRPYPTGGACYELELYLAVDACQQLSFGLYHYAPSEHLLYQLSSQRQQVEALLDDAALSVGQPNRPQVLIILAARFQRVAWKYSSLAYALILKDVGVLYQTMYLIATAMKLAPCALGGGNADLFATAAGTNYYVESSVGEFILGSRPDMGEYDG